MHIYVCMYVYIYYETLLSIAVVGINTAVCKLPVMSSVFNFSSDSDNFAGTVPKAPKTNSTITVFTRNCLLTSVVKSMYLSIFSSSFFFNMMVHWDRKMRNVPRVLLPVNYYHISTSGLL